MTRTLPLALLMLLCLVPAWTAASAAQGTGAHDATLRWTGRDIVTFRATLTGVPPEARLARALRRLDDLDARGVRAPLVQVPITIDGQQGFLVQAGENLVFTLLPGDLEPGDATPLADYATAARARLQDALDARRAQRDPLLLAHGLGWSAASLLLALAASVPLLRLRRWVSAGLNRRLAGMLGGNAPWVVYLGAVTQRVVEILLLFVLAAVAYLWLTFALAQFPLTQPFGERLGAFLLEMLGGFGTAFIAALPDLVTLLVIILITRAVVQSLGAMFDAAREGRIELPGLHRETMPATRRIVMVVVCALGLTFAYPYIPGSQSDVFKGLSVLFGFMLTLGSAGVVSQLMSGLTLVYTRALRRGDLVRIGNSVGTVMEIGALSTRLRNLYNEDITIPNSVVVAAEIRNLSRLDDAGGVAIGTTVTIGYDTPWRQVHAMLLNAARNTDGLRREPAPCVLQRALGDFYVEYELLVTLSAAADRFQVLSRLNAAIQDEFNTHGVQIMSPNFVAQPAQPVLVPRERWHLAPAEQEPPARARSGD